MSNYYGLTNLMNRMRDTDIQSKLSRKVLAIILLVDKLVDNHMSKRNDKSWSLTVHRTSPSQPEENSPSQTATQSHAPSVPAGPDAVIMYVETKTAYPSTEMD